MIVQFFGSLYNKYNTQSELFIFFWFYLILFIIHILCKLLEFKFNKIILITCFFLTLNVLINSVNKLFLFNCAQSGFSASPSILILV